MIKKTLGLLICLGGMAAGAAQAVVITYTDRAAWESALVGSAFIEETFDGVASSFSENSIGNSAGIFTIDMIGGVGDTGPTGLTGTGLFEGEVDSSSFASGDGLNLLFNSALMSGFGLLGLQDDSVNSPGGLDLEEIGIEVAGMQFLISDILGLTDPLVSGQVGTVENSIAIPFIGFVSTLPIDSFKLIHGDQVRAVAGGNEAFYLDGIVVAASTVPEPGTLALFIGGIVGLGLAGRRRNNIKTSI